MMQAEDGEQFSFKAAGLGLRALGGSFTFVSGLSYGGI